MRLYYDVTRVRSEVLLLTFIKGCRFDLIFSRQNKTQHFKFIKAVALFKIVGWYVLRLFQLPHLR